MHPTLARLERLATALSSDPGVIAILGLGSAGVEHDRFDEHSDIDFFLIVDRHETKQRYVDDLEWLDGFGGDVTYSFVNDPNGRKALLADGLFLEYAVFTLPEVVRIPFAGARIIWQRPDADLDLERHPGPPQPTSLDTVEFHVHEALTNLYVGLHRELRGERLTAMRFIQVYAIDRVLALLRLDPLRQWELRDPFEPTRRVESAFPHVALPLSEMITGYRHNRTAAATTLAWLTQHYDTDPVIVRAIEELLAT